jgi:3-oxoacyl-[acyl-carrier protein] reductase
MLLKDRVALVTGASRGIGAATAKILAQRGARVAASARTVSDLEAVAASIREK